MSYFVAGLTNDNPNIIAPVYKQYHHVQYNDSLPASATASVSFPPSVEMFRYVIIQQEFTNTNAICLAEVKVFLRGSFTYFSTWNIIILLEASQQAKIQISSFIFDTVMYSTNFDKWRFHFRIYILYVKQASIFIFHELIKSSSMLKSNSIIWIFGCLFCLFPFLLLLSGVQSMASVIYGYSW